MKKLRSLILVLAAVLFISPVASVTAFATGSGQTFADYQKDYKYTVRVYAGSQGTFNSNSVDGGDFTGDRSKDDCIVIKAPYGSIVTLQNIIDDGYLKMPDGSKYTAIGLREAGRDNNEIGAFAFSITSDIDYVIGYGMEGGEIAYVINYVDEEGQELAASETHYGKAGDKPVVAFKYIEGYVPQALALTKTLDEDETKNVFTFTYVPGDSSRFGHIIIDGGEIVSYVDGGIVYEYIPGQVINAGAVNVVDQGVAIQDEDVPLQAEEGPAELIDLDDGSVPLAGDDFDFEYKEADKIGFFELPIYVIIIVILCILVLLVLLVFLLVKFLRKKKNKELDKISQELEESAKNEKNN